MAASAHASAPAKSGGSGASVGSGAWFGELRTSVSLYVKKEYFKFNAAHFIAHETSREKLHGHNYRAAVQVEGPEYGPDGYLMDFGTVKSAMKRLCATLDERFLCPKNSSHLEISVEGGYVSIQTRDGKNYRFPEEDCAMLPVGHTSAEELANYLLRELLRDLGPLELIRAQVSRVAVTVFETPEQSATIAADLARERRE